MDQRMLKEYAASYIKGEIERLQGVLQELEERGTVSVPVATVRAVTDDFPRRKRQRRPMSAAAKKAISKRMKARWAAIRARA